jgi:hypothetical protein
MLNTIKKQIEDSKKLRHSKEKINYLDFDVH